MNSDEVHFRQQIAGASLEEAGEKGVQLSVINYR